MAQAMGLIVGPCLATQTETIVMFDGKCVLQLAMGVFPL